MPVLTDAFLHHYRELLSFLSLRTGSRDTAQDCAQDTWIKLSESGDRAQPENQRAYVFRVAANIATDWHRRLARERQANERYASGLTGQTEADTLDVAAARQTLRRLQAVLLAQPARSLEIFVLHRHEGLTYRAIAEHCRVSVSAVEKHMMRVLLACDAALQA
ncbi:RNA polymerase subunit sigma-70 [Bordetella genomosp. 5]|uniref:RNA polymerase subunit sigma-70 n=1 Tax=Bordetella genomosp. 5 TaxID=1395608 RepID=A0A261TY33_9BORD|nr:RNA polymerase sigma factor [Bordetella genomosp. 5]OZI44622.1 RNA polymerase subunit sigma-70 [Bordetella genomosp. 5]OZI53523.1 RNA polymerase subunit sigma-70 [Bordetella genomosp. 5]